MNPSRATVRDVQSVQSGLDQTRDSLDRLAQEDVVIDNARRLLLRSPNGHYWAIQVDNAGTLSAVDMGTRL